MHASSLAITASYSAADDQLGVMRVRMHTVQ